MNQIIHAISHPMTGLVLLLIPTVTIWVLYFTTPVGSNWVPYHAPPGLVLPTIADIPTGKGEPLVTLAPSPTARQALYLLPTITALSTDAFMPLPTVTAWPTIIPLLPPTIMMLPTLAPVLLATATPTITPVVMQPLPPPTIMMLPTLVPTLLATVTPTITPVVMQPPTPETLPFVTVVPSGIANISIVFIKYDGLVPTTESDEYAEVANNAAIPIDIGGWRLYGGDRGQDFVFPSFNLAPGQHVRVYTNEIHPEFGGFSFSRFQAVWNNEGDCGVLYDASEVQVSEYCYSPGP